MNLRKLLYPLSILYDGVTRIRNYAYAREWLESTRYETPVVSVGNLSVGGTGKSPMIEYLIAFLAEDYRIAVLSRGYKRQTKGYLEVTTKATVAEVGDEPLQIKKKYPHIMVAVCADRRTGIEQLQSKAELILLDDAFQHRKVAPALQIVLTAYDDLFLDDLVLPAGNLRESSKGSERADIIVVTKCPINLAYAKQNDIQYRMNLQKDQRIFFSTIAYSDTIISNFEKLSLDYLHDKKFTLITGIAKPEPLVGFLKDKGFKFEHEAYPDHHNFTKGQLDSIQKKELVLTTEKDFMRLQSNVNKKALYYLPITTYFLNEQGVHFQAEIMESLRSFRLD